MFDRKGTHIGDKPVFLDATEEEMIELIQSMLKELELTTYFLEMPTERRTYIEATIAAFDAYLLTQYPQLVRDAVDTAHFQNHSE